MTGPQQYDDPIGDGGAKVLQALAVLATVGEAAAGFAVMGAQNRAARAEQHNRIEGTVDRARTQADLVAQRAATAQRQADRRLMDKAFDDAWLAGADIDTVANLWRTAVLYATSGDQRAAAVVRRAQERLAALNPGLVDAYQRHRGNGASTADAMRAATTDVWAHQTRPPSRAVPLGPGPDPDGQRMVDQLDAAVRAEVARLAAGVDLNVLEQFQRQHRSAGHAPIADTAEVLAAAARHLRAQTALHNPAASPVRSGADVVEQPTIDDARLDVSTVDDGFAREFEEAARTVRLARAEQRHLASRAEQDREHAVVEQAQPDHPATALDEHQTGVATGRGLRGRAEYDESGAAQRARHARAFPPLGTVAMHFSHPPAPTSQPGPVRRTGANR